MLNPMIAIGPYTPGTHAPYCVGTHPVSLLTTEGDGMLPIVVRDMVTDEILRFTRTGIPAPGENRMRLCIGREVKNSKDIIAAFTHERQRADVRRAMCDELVQYEAGSPEAVALSKMMKAVNDVLRGSDTAPDESAHTDEEEIF
jgi:hypothetical protein